MRVCKYKCKYKEINVDVKTFRIGCEFQNGCPNGACRADEDRDNCEEENGTNVDDDPQILRHLVFLILLLCSMFIVRLLFSLSVDIIRIVKLILRCIL